MRNLYQKLHKKSFWIGYIIGIIIFIVSLMTFATYVMDRNMEVEGEEPEIPSLVLEDIQVVDLNDKSYALTSLKGKPIVIDFWATWCTPCVKEHPAYDSIAKKYSSQINFISISDEKLEKIKDYEQKKKYSFKFYKSTKAFSDFGLYVRPAMYVYDENGKLIHKQIGMINDSIIQSLL